MYRIIHTILLGQDGNEGLEQEIIEGFESRKQAQEFIDKNFEQNGWHRFEIEKI